MFKNTADLRESLCKLYQQIEAGEISNAQARVKVGAAKAILDTIKIEIAAAALGKQFSAVNFAQTDVVEPDKTIRRIS